jgi:tetratricopeptide (TPR) repeat protein
MSQILVRDSFFDITLTSDAYQDIFPENTVSFFRAKLPAKLVLPRQLPYKVALYKLNYINSINNIGKGANTRMVISTDKYHAASVHFPDVCVDDPLEFIQVMISQMKQTVPGLFKNQDTVRFAFEPVLKPSVPFTPLITQADQPANEFERKAVARYQSIKNFVNEGLTILYDRNLEWQELYLKFRIYYSQKTYDESLEFHGKTIDDWINIVKKPNPFTKTMKHLRFIGHIEYTYFKKLDEIFYTEPFDKEKWSKHFRELLKHLIQDNNELVSKFGKSKSRFFVPINHDNVNEIEYIHSFETFRRLWKSPEQIDENDEYKEIKKEMLDLGLTEFAIEIENIVVHLKYQIELHKRHLQSTFSRKNIYNNIASHLSHLIKLNNYLRDFYSKELEFMKDRIKIENAFERRPQDAVINPETQAPFRTEGEWVEFMSPVYSTHGQLVDKFRDRERIWSKGISQY